MKRHHADINLPEPHTLRQRRSVSRGTRLIDLARFLLTHRSLEGSNQCPPVSGSPKARHPKVAEVAMNVHAKYRDTPDQEFTAQLANTLHLTSGAADEWLGIFLLRYAERRYAASGHGLHAAEAPRVSVPGEAPREHAAA